MNSTQSKKTRNPPKKITQVLLKPFELADVYALRTLEDYLLTNARDFRCFIDPEEDFLGADAVLKKMRVAPAKYNLENPQNVLSVYSDLNCESHYRNALEIDISILKNCAKPVSSSEKQKLRKKYDIDPNKPVITIGYSQLTLRELDMLYATRDIATQILVGRVPHADLIHHETGYRLMRGLNGKLLDWAKIVKVTEKGMLRDYYALSDFTVNSQNLGQNDCGVPMHNFVEAVRGGPHYLVRPKNTEQFGYFALVKRGAIVESSSAEEIGQKLRHALRNFTPDKQHAANVAAHLESCREKYLPLLADFMRYAFNGGRRPRTNLKVERAHYHEHKLLRVTHPETDWGRPIVVI